MRSLWDNYITQLAPHFAFDMDEIDPALARIKKEELGPIYGD